MPRPRRRYLDRRPDQYDPNSINATLATLISEQRSFRQEINDRTDVQDKILGEIKVQAIKTNGRVNVLESWRDISTAKLAGMAAGVGVCSSLIVWLIQIIVK